jgi:hypothetical protein
MEPFVKANEHMFIDMYHAQLERGLTLHRAFEQERGNALLFLSGLQLLQHVGDRQRCLRDLIARTSRRDEHTRWSHNVSDASLYLIDRRQKLLRR